MDDRLHICVCHHDKASHYAGPITKDGQTTYVIGACLCHGCKCPEYKDRDEAEKERRR